MSRQSGTYRRCNVAGEGYRAYLPTPLPPTPGLAIDTPLQERLDRANRAIGRLDGISAVLPDTTLFLYFYVRKEALLSSQIEGTQSSLSDLLLFEGEQTPVAGLDDVREVSNYVAAMDHGLRRMRQDNFPLSLRLIREMHAILLREGRGAAKDPGEFRRSQNWIGGSRPGNARFVPPPPEAVMDCLGSLEKFLHDDPQPTPLLIKAALAHVQFETIHPFLDGNGRMGRLLITLLLCGEGALKEPLLYLSLYFKAHRDAYYDWLQRVRETGDWEGWLGFFLTGVEETAETATETARRILGLFAADRSRIADGSKSGATDLRLHEQMQKRPVFTVAQAMRALAMTAPTVAASIARMERLGIVKETTGRKRDRVYSYAPYLAILSEGAEPIG
ncbi:Fic family protein [Parasulfuritortus cantonensis]|uniref:Fic family protein n=2 Tax=Parasulfuritortus cantonensis TaxID=2528202 RepID=A0A4R1B4H0_9PROT|nr:Fic family protein [Parasulfuritortus cantonensis]